MSATILTPRERYLETVLFGRPDRILFMPGGPRKSTLEAWHRQGLPAGQPWREALLREIGICEEPAEPQPDLGVSFRLMPTFEERPSSRSWRWVCST